MTTPPLRAAFYVQHLLGIGHLYRAKRICDALVNTGVDVSLIAGGMPARALEGAAFSIVQLDAVRSGDAGFSGLVDQDGTPLDEPFKARRRDQLLDAVTRIRPHVVVTEAYPFGRRQMRFELLPLVQHISSLPHAQRPALLCSIRDILQEGRKASRNAETVEILNQHYDAVLVHGAPTISTLADTFPDAGSIKIPVHNTGLVAPPPMGRSGDRPSAPTFDVLVTAGGGAVGRDLLGAAADAAAQSKLPGQSVALVTGPNAPANLADELTQRAQGKATVTPFISNLPAALASAKLSISQAGYNTVADILVASCPAVLVPFAEGGETEQTRRAEALQRAGRCVHLAQSDCDASQLSEAAHQAVSMKSTPLNARLDGADRSARIIIEAANKAMAG